MNIKNYTSGVSVMTTISRIEQFLATAGASSISKEYAPDASLRALTFRIRVPSGNEISIRLPADADAVYRSLSQKVKRPHRGTMNRLKEQSSRTAWKLMQDWVEVQCSLIQMQQADVIEVFLPYVWDERKKLTLYDSFKQGGFKALPEHVS